MTGMPQFNFPRFAEVAAILTELGYKIINPADLDLPAVREAALRSDDGALDEAGRLGGETWGDLLARDIKIVADVVDGVVAMDQWNISRGARLEVFTALQVGKPVFWYRGGRVYPLSKSDAMRTIMLGMFHADR